MTDITVVVVDREGQRISLLPDANLKTLVWELVAPGSFSFSIHPLADGAETIQLVKTEVQIWFDDQIVHWGVPWSCGSSDGGELTFQCEGVLSLLRMRYVDDMSMDYSSIDQHSIVWDLISYAQSEATQANRDLNISSNGFGPSGVPRSPRYDRSEHANILDIIQEFPNMSNGFEYDIVLSPDGTQRWWTPYYPAKGSVKTEHAMRWDSEKSRNIAKFTYAEDAKQILTHGYVTGGSSGEVKFEANYEDVAASAEYGVMQGVISDGTQMDVDWLLERATHEVEKRKRPLITTQVTSVTSEHLELGDVVVGDWVPVTINYGRIQADDEYRVKTVTWNPDETLTFGFDGEIAA